MRDLKFKLFVTGCTYICQTDEILPGIDYCLHQVYISYEPMCRSNTVLLSLPHTAHGHLVLVSTTHIFGFAFLCQSVPPRFSVGDGSAQFACLQLAPNHLGYIQQLSWQANLELRAFDALTRSYTRYKFVTYLLIYLLT